MSAREETFMQGRVRVLPISTKRSLAGHIMGGLALLFLLFDSVIKLVVLAPVVESFDQLGYDVRLAPLIGTIELICILVYVVPQTAIFGAILLTGYLGGAVATHVRVGSPLASHVLFPLYIAALVWGALYVRDERLRGLIPVQR